MGPLCCNNSSCSLQHAQALTEAYRYPCSVLWTAAVSSAFIVLTNCPHESYLCACSILWMAVSSALIVLNKQLLSVVGFHYPMALSGLGMAFSSLAGFVVCKVSGTTVFWLRARASSRPWWFLLWAVNCQLHVLKCRRGCSIVAWPPNRWLGLVSAMSGWPLHIYGACEVVQGPQLPRAAFAVRMIGCDATRACGGPCQGMPACLYHLQGGLCYF